jgi:polar amino acid transport system substrate-binding protein
MNVRTWIGAAFAAALLTVGTACASTSNDATRKALDALDERPRATVTPTTVPVDLECERYGPAASFAPTEPLPVPGRMPAGTFMDHILRQGYLRVGVDENTAHFSFRNAEGEIVGFEVDLANKISEAIFGDSNPGRVRLVSVVTDEKVPVVRDGDVDLTISVVSAACDRWSQVAFSTSYYATTQRILVRTSSKIDNLDDLAGKRVCVTRGSSSERYVESSVPEAKLLPLTARTDCLVALQEGRVQAVVLPNSILVGLRDQDPTTKLVTPVPARPQSYGIPISHDHPEFVQFVNGLLERWRADGTLAQLQDEWFANSPELRTDPIAPAAQYRPQ